MTYEEKKQYFDIVRLNHINSDCRWLTKQQAFLIKELEKAWAALEFYADKRNWEASFVNEYDVLGEPGYVHGDHGKRAREALDD